MAITPESKKTHRQKINKERKIIEQLLERTAVVAFEEESSLVHEEPYRNQLEKELKRIMKESNFENMAMIYRNFYKESGNPYRINELF